MVRTIINLKREITDLKRKIDMREKELSKSKTEIELLKKELTQQQQFTEFDNELINDNDTKLVENVEEILTFRSNSHKKIFLMLVDLIFKQQYPIMLKPTLHVKNVV